MTSLTSLTPGMRTALVEARRTGEIADIIRGAPFTSCRWMATTDSGSTSVLSWALNEHGHLVAELLARIADLEQSLEMSCTEPADRCTCSGCSYAREKNGFRANDE